MSDGYWKTAIRTAIKSHAMAFSLDLPSNLTSSMTQMSMVPSVDLFHFLEPFGVKQWSYSANKVAARFYESGENYFYNELDYSQVK